ncbi:MAG: hypothetical protein A2135_00300 [Actinobacteria bacterium RBG_16_67_15]|nr:MAG: hypothetical protein A2135_00300 [Actinobacteria bacterium RBG_16_67_15]
MENAHAQVGRAMTPTTAARALIAVVAFSVVLVPGDRVIAHPDDGTDHDTPWIGDVVSRSAPGAAGAFEMRVVVAADEEFVRSRGEGWEADARAVVMGAEDLMLQVDLVLFVTETTRWESPPGPLPELVDDVVSQVGLPPEAILVALTSQSWAEAPFYDGWAAASRPVIVIKVTDPHRETLRSLVAHELGHMLGLDEHGSDHPGDDDGCLMVATGYRHGDRWCPEDKEAVARVLADIP